MEALVGIEAVKMQMDRKSILKKLTSVLILTVLAMVVCFAVIWGKLRYWESRHHFESNGPLDAQPLDLIKTAVPQHKDFPVTTPCIGRVESRQSLTIVALEAGTIISVDAEDETIVEKDSPLFALGGSRVEGRLVPLRGKVASLRQQVDLSKETVARKQQAVDQRLSSVDELDAAKAALTRLQMELETATQELQSLQGVTHIRAPVKGIFTGRRISIAQEVEKGDVLAEMIVPEQVRVVATLFPPGDISLQGRPVMIHTASGEGLSGLVSKILPQHTSAGATIVWIESDDINQQLKPGEIASGDVLLATHTDSLALPQNAVVYDEQETPWVFLKDGQGYRQQRVQTRLSSNGWIEIVSGVTDKDEVVIQGAYELFYRDFNKVYKVAD